MALCNRCDAEIGFAQTPGGKWQPVDALSGEPHRCAKSKPAPANNGGGSLERQATTGATIAWSSMNPLPREEQGPTPATTPVPAPATYAPEWGKVTPTREEIVGPMRRTELQELRHAVQRLSRAVELLSEQLERAFMEELKS